MIPFFSALMLSMMKAYLSLSALIVVVLMIPFEDPTVKYPKGSPDVIA